LAGAGIIYLGYYYVYPLVVVYFSGTGPAPEGSGSVTTPTADVATLNIASTPAEVNSQTVISSHVSTSSELEGLKQILELRARQFERASVRFDRLVKAAEQATPGPDQVRAQADAFRAAEDLTVAIDKAKSATNAYQQELEKLNRGLQDPFETFDFSDLWDAFS